MAKRQALFCIVTVRKIIKNENEAEKCMQDIKKVAKKIEKNRKEKNATKLLPWVTAVAMFIQSLDGTILNTSLPVIAKDMGYSPSDMHSVIVTYALTLALFIPLSGWMADKFGTRSMFMVAVGLFVAGSLCCAFSVDLFTFNLFF